MPSTGGPASQNLTGTLNNLIVNFIDSANAVLRQHGVNELELVQTGPQATESANHASAPASGGSHPGITCDYCREKPIKGIRYKCNTCADFDLCHACMIEVEAKHRHYSKHPFRAILPLPSNVQRSLDPSAPSLPTLRKRPQMHTAYCDNCTHWIAGNRHKCAVCPNYDLCDRCLRVSPSVHSEGHSFRLLEKPLTTPVAQIVPTAAADPPNFPAAIPVAARSHPVVPPVPMAPPAPNPPPSQSGAGIPASDTIPRAFCDVCLQDIDGSRFKCLTCANYDMCKSCFYQSRENHTREHTFVSLYRPAPTVHLRIAETREVLMSIKPDEPDVKFGATCDICRIRITGTRMACVDGACGDYDLCSNCFGDPDKCTEHFGGSHAFVKLVKPGEVWVLPGGRGVLGGRQGGDKRTARGGQPSRATCSSCSSQITGVRYKCFHANCPDIHLCASCEALNPPVHPVDHPLVKYKDNPPADTSPELDAKPSLNDEGETPRQHEASSSGYNALFITDLSTPDGSSVRPGAHFTKTWRIRNDGAVPWPSSTVVTFVGGQRWAPPEGALTHEYPVGKVDAGKDIDVSVELVAGESEQDGGTGYWRLRDAATGMPFGDRLWCSIVIKTPEMQSLMRLR